MCRCECWHPGAGAGAACSTRVLQPCPALSPLNLCCTATWQLPLHRTGAAHHLPVPNAQTSAASWPGSPLSTQGASHLPRRQREVESPCHSMVPRTALQLRASPDCWFHAGPGSPRTHRGLVIRTVLAALAVSTGLDSPKSLTLTRQEASTSWSSGRRRRQAVACEQLVSSQGGARVGCGTAGTVACSARPPGPPAHPAAFAPSMLAGEKAQRARQVSALEIPMRDRWMSGVQKLEARGRIQRHGEQPLPAELGAGLQGRVVGAAG